jgi:2'-5' RNA ligase
MRLFIAIELPDEIKRVLAGMRAEIPGSRWVPMEQIHLTLAFLGEVDDGMLKVLTAELATIHAPGFSLRFSGIGCFPDRRRPRVLWVGLEPEPLLGDLAAKVSAVVPACGISREERPFSPHITLARLTLPAAREVGTFLDQPRTQELPLFDVREFILFQSRLTPRGAIHTPVRRFPLFP